MAETITDAIRRLEVLIEARTREYHDCMHRFTEDSDDSAKERAQYIRHVIDKLESEAAELKKGLV